MNPLFELTGVGRRFGTRRGGGNWALKDVDLTIEPGRHLGIVGESGAGKTTLLQILLGLDTATTGTVLADGTPLTRARARLRAHRRFVQPVFQDPYSSLDPRQRVDRIIAEPLRSLGLAAGADAAGRVADALRSVGLDADAATRYPHEFSGGQRQRIAIARAIVAQPRLLLADEPVSALDLATRVRVINLLAEVAGNEAAAANPLTIVLVSHDLSIVARLCHEVVVLERGRIVERGSTEGVLHAPREPYTRRLLASVPRLPQPTTEPRTEPTTPPRI